MHIKNTYLPTNHPAFATPGAARVHHRQTSTFLTSQAKDGPTDKGLITRLAFELMEDGQPQPSSQPQHGKPCYPRREAHASSQTTHGAWDNISTFHLSTFLLTDIPAWVSSSHRTPPPLPRGRCTSRRSSRHGTEGGMARGDDDRTVTIRSPNDGWPAGWGGRAATGSGQFSPRHGICSSGLSTRMVTSDTCLGRVPGYYDQRGIFGFFFFFRFSGWGSRRHGPCRLHWLLFHLPYGTGVPVSI
ncbi:hypothetical protein B0T18DRAFT_128761 [Schizothecium vesticola]|uniref:Uncharacterized protein n=1 Tax=Schizothecium vesticola TaxID=314040 RepID=A0AA40F3N9_9PEZI|nr:hypothetical protein B0T18DRAFT_128761 [Schizothecium vesticola]